ncbi:ABC transporter ATP-binding protein [Brevibacillus ruminantium]|uniref:ABC transporter ATP-binding protein n=1 Tax=Brevibacillus ruminantium TaxID=2950604 RepID=A0ABY4WAK7_9BACL|nr:ABC transporter ATP-binding protein [Brevibacillus ruminantium]USG64072.1 ABC transporter ATP-binding protein [Brevibacillus ruminantium]
MNAIEVIGLTKQIGNRPVLCNVTFSVPPGTVCALIGPNGAGKTTLIHTLLGLAKPTAGKSLIFEKNADEKSGLVRSEVGFMTAPAFPNLRVKELLRLCAALYPLWDERLCRHLQELFGLASELPIRQLSKGMKVQLSLVIALSARPRVLLLDEPTSGLDPVHRQSFFRLIMDVVAERETTVLFTTHHPEEAERMADNVGMLLEGRLLFHASVDELKRTSRCIQAVLPDGLPKEIRELPGVLHVKQQGSMYSLFIRDHVDETTERIRLLAPSHLDILPASLEELFIYTASKEGYSFDTAACSESAI